jgi:hypothetical protein
VSEVNQTIPSFVNGVSKQAVESRHATQVEEMINCNVSFVDGTRRRAPLEKIALLPDLDGTKPYLYSYERGDGVESYLVAVLDGEWFVYDLDGTKIDSSASDVTAWSSATTYAVGDLVSYSASGLTAWSSATTYAVGDMVESAGSGWTAKTANTNVTPVAGSDWDVNVTSGWTSKTAHTNVRPVVGTNWSKGANSVPYLRIPSTADPVDSFTSTTIGDTTFLVNKTKVVAENSTYTHGTSDVNHHMKYAYYWVKRTYIAYGNTDNQQASTYQYKVISNTGTTLRPTDTEASSTTGANAYGKNSLTVANTMAGDLSSATNSGSVLRQLKNNAGSWEVSDSWGNMASEGWWGYMSKIQDLPEDMGSYSGSNTLIKITGDEKNNFEGFWTNYLDGVWKESVASGLKTGMDKATMPHTLVRTSLTNFTFGEFDYTDRKVGDDFTNSMPSFVGYTIEDLFFYRNRLGMISRDSIILSEVGLYENFFRTTVTDLLATDPVDVAVDSNKVVNLKYAVPFKRNLLLFGANAQYILSSDNELRPDTVSISQSTEYSLNPKTKPIALGPNTYFTVNKGAGTQVREYYNVPDSVDNIAEDITAHVSEYIPNNAVDLEGSDKYDMLFILSGASDAERANIYVYNQTWEGTKKAQSAWHRWELASAKTHILAIRVLGDHLYMICHFNDPDLGVQGEMVLKRISLAKTDYESISYNDLIGDSGVSDLGLPYASSIELSEWGFNTGGTAKVDDKQGRLQIRKIELQTRTGSTQKIKVQVGDATHTKVGDSASVMGETKKTRITIQSSGDSGFCIDSTNLKGRYNSRSRTV